jgi:hypothetical protein
MSQAPHLPTVGAQNVAVISSSVTTRSLQHEPSDLPRAGRRAMQFGHHFLVHPSKRDAIRVEGW